MSQSPTFRVKLTGDFYDEAGHPKFPQMGLDVLDDASHIGYESFDEHRAEIGADQVADAQGVIVLSPQVTAQTVSQADELLAVGRFGVGYDTVDVEACTEANVAAFITAGAVDRSVAEATVGWMIALTHHVRAKDLLVRQGLWADRTQYMGCELRHRTFGAVGLGGIARAAIGLLDSFTMNPPLAFDPYVCKDVAKSIGTTLVPLDDLMAQADFVSVHCPLTDATHDLIGAAQIARMKPTAYLLNTARGGIVNEDALYDALKHNRIAGAAIDCFVDEPTTSNHRFSELDNVLLAPHAIAWTNEMFGDIGRAVCGGMIDLSLGRQPRGVLNPQVFEKPKFIDKWRRHQHES